MKWVLYVNKEVVLEFIVSIKSNVLNYNGLITIIISIFTLYTKKKQKWNYIEI